MLEKMINKATNEAIRKLLKKKNFLEKEITGHLVKIKELEEEKEKKEQALNQFLAKKKEVEEKKVLQKSLEKELNRVIRQEEELKRKMRRFGKLSLKSAGPQARKELIWEIGQTENQRRDVGTKKQNLQKELEKIKNRMKEIEEKLRLAEREDSLRSFLGKAADLISREKAELERRTREMKELERKIIEEKKRGEERQREEEKRKVQEELERKRKEEEKRKKEGEKKKREALSVFLNQAISLCNQKKFEESLAAFKNTIQEAEKLKEELGFLARLFGKKTILFQARKYSSMTERAFKKQRQKQAEEKKYLRREELQLLFQKALDYYNKNEVEVAAKLSESLLKELEDEKKKVGFIEKIGIIAPLARKTKRILDKIQKKKREEEIRKRQVQKLKELEEIIIKKKEQAKKPEDIEKQKEEPIKKYEEEQQARQKEITEKYEKELERQMNELLQKQKELKMEDQILRKEAVEEVTERERLRERMAEQEREFAKRKAELKERYEQELERAKKILEERRAEELKRGEEKLKAEETKKGQEVLRKKEKELKSQEAEARKMREAPAEVLTEEEEMKRKEAILKAEEEIRGKRKMIEEETKTIEQEEIKRKQLEERRQKPVAEEETEAEKEKRRAWLKETIRKEKEMMAPEEMEREKQEKEATLKTLFEEAIFHYKEKNFDRAIEIFQELKKELPEPKKEPGFFSRIFGKIPLYIQIENYISKIEKEKILEEKRRIREIREYARIAAGEKRKAKYQLFPNLKRKISKWFPASPLVIFRKFLFLPPLVAIDISDYSIELLRLNKKLSIVAYGRSIIKEGIVHEGKIKDQKELSLAFKLAVNQAGFKPFRPRRGHILRGIVSIPEYKTNVQTFTFKSRDNIFEKVKEEIKKTVPFPIDEIYWDYLEYWDEKLNKTKALVVAVLKDIIDEQIYFLKSCGVEPVVFDLEAASIGRTLLPEKVVLEKTGTLILDIGARVTNINIFDENGFINLSTAIPSAGHYLVDKIAEHFSVSKEEAETIMNIKGFRKEDNVILEVLEKGMEKIVEETNKAIKHYQKKTGNEIKKIILSGGTALLPAIDKFFQSRFQDIEIEIGDPLKKIKRGGGIDPTKAVLYANSLGLALRSIIKDPIGGGINLLPGKIKEKEKKVYWQRHRQKLIIIQIILVALIAAAALLVYLYIW